MKIELMRKIEVVPIGSIKPYENNPRVTDDAVMDDDRYYCYQARDNNRGGKTKAQFFIEEERALANKQESLFDLAELMK